MTEVLSRSQCVKRSFPRPRKETPNPSITISIFHEAALAIAFLYSRTAIQVVIINILFLLQIYWSVPVTLATAALRVSKARTFTAASVQLAGQAATVTQVSS